MSAFPALEPDGLSLAIPDTSLAALSPLSFLRRSAYVFRDRPAAVFEGGTLTYAALLERVERLVGALQTRGVVPGQRVAALLPNLPAMLELHFAVPGAGAVLVPMNTRLGPDELTYILEHSGTSLLFVHTTLTGTLQGVLDRLPTPVEVVVVGGHQDEYEPLLAGAQEIAMRTPRETDLLSINYTSGTTSSPKGVMYVHRGAYLHALGVVAEAGLTTSSQYLWTLPMFHCNGWAFTWAVTAMGGRHVCLERFDAAVAWRLLREHDITHLCGAPTVMTMLCEHPHAAPLGRSVQALIGGAPPSPALLERATALGFEITQLYGLTETYGPLCACVHQPSWNDRSPSERARLKSRQGVATVVSERLRVVDTTMRDVPADGTTLGEVVAHGNNVAIGYYRNPGATAEAFVDGVFHTGDLAVLHPDGYLELRDRAKDIIISGGENISTIEVEHTLSAHPAVSEAAVVGVPDDHWGEVPRAFVTLRGEAAATGEELRSWLRTRIARYKVPREIVILPELPKTATNKVQKFLLREGIGDDPRG